MGFAIFLKYKQNQFVPFFKRIVGPLIAALIITIGVGAALKMQNPYYLMMLFASTFTVAGNLNYISSILNGRIKKAGASISHVGFGILMLGALISMSSNQIISVILQVLMLLN